MSTRRCEPGTTAGSRHVSKIPDQSSFFRLPPEIRNLVYDYTVVRGRTLIIRDMLPQEWRRCRARSTFLATDHNCHSICWVVAISHDTIPCPLRDRWNGPMPSSYTLSQALLAAESIPGLSTTLAMLSLDKRTREEVASIFYSENTFHFYSISSLLPFMKDRPEDTRKYIHRLQLTFTIDERNWYEHTDEHRRPAAWDTALSSLRALPHLNIKTLYLKIDDMRKGMLLRGLGLKLESSRSMHWLHTLSNLNNLDQFGLEYSCNPLRERKKNKNENAKSKTPDDPPHVSKRVKGNNRTEEELWAFLAPRMLKKMSDDDGDEHNADALQKRRIWPGTLEKYEYSIAKG